MKKKILLSTTFFAVVALAVTVNINLNSHKAQSALTLANIEALARSHGGGEDEWAKESVTGRVVYEEDGVMIEKDCCVPSVATDACNVGVIRCMAG